MEKKLFCRNYLLETSVNDFQLTNMNNRFFIFINCKIFY